MKILGIDASAGPSSVCLVEERVVLGEVYQNTGLTHSQTLVPMVEQLFQLTGRTLQEVDGIAVTSGPGSFTGVRIGLSVAKGLALGLGKKLCPVSTLAAMAEPLRQMEHLICAVMDARRNQVYFGLFDQNGIRLCQDQAIELQQAEQILKKQGNPILLVGDGAQLCYNFCKETISDIQIAPVHLQCRNALGAAFLALRGQESLEEPERVVPTYLRLSQAERERLAKREKETQGKSEEE